MHHIVHKEVGSARLEKNRWWVKLKRKKEAKGKKKKKKPSFEQNEAMYPS